MATTAGLEAPWIAFPSNPTGLTPGTPCRSVLGDGVHISRQLGCTWPRYGLFEVAELLGFWGAEKPFGRDKPGQGDLFERQVPP